MNKGKKLANPLLARVSELIEKAQTAVVQSVNVAMVYTYYEIGRMIVEEEQKGKHRAEYGKKILLDLSKRLTKNYGKGYSATNLEQMRKFYLVYCPKARLSRKSGDRIPQTLSEEFTLSWSHYLKLMRMDSDNERCFYEIEAKKNRWSLRELERQFDSSLYERLAYSKNKEKVKRLSTHGQEIEKAKDVIKDPYVLEFIGLKELPNYTESDLERKLIDNLQWFMMELGKGFTFVGRQIRISFDEQHFRVDLVFYNRLLRCFVLIDLMRGKLKHQDLGQMQMYVNYYDRYVKEKDENPTIGILLCADKSDTMVEITLSEHNEQIFVSKYQSVIPSKEMLKSALRR